MFNNIYSNFITVIAANNQAHKATPNILSKIKQFIKNGCWKMIGLPNEILL